MVKNPPANAGDLRDLGSIPESGLKIPWRRKWQPIPVFLAGKFHGQRSLVGYCPWVHKESDTTERLSTHIEEGKGFGHCISSTFSVVGITQIVNKLFFLCVPNLI